MRIPTFPVVLRAGAVLLAAVLALAGVLDAGSVVLTRMAVPDDARSAGYAAAEAASGQPLVQQTAVAAFEAASDVAGLEGAAVATDDFVIYPDGSVALTLRRTAPTLVLHRLPALGHLAVVTESTTVEALPYS